MFIFFEADKDIHLVLFRQWSWPLPLPVQFFGIFPTGGTITEDNQELPWSDELEHKIFISAIGKEPLTGTSAGTVHFPMLPNLDLVLTMVASLAALSKQVPDTCL